MPCPSRTVTRLELYEELVTGKDVTSAPVPPGIARAPTGLGILYSISDPGYPATGPNAYHPGILPEPDNLRAFETINVADYDGLHALRQFVNVNRVALGLDLVDRTDPRWR
jgi:hypothetical protein